MLINVSFFVRSLRSFSVKYGGGDEKIKVCVRKRFLNKKEIKCGESDIVVVVSIITLVVNELKVAVDLILYIL